MSDEVKRDLPFLLFEVRAGLYAVGSESVREIVILPKVTELPELPPEIRGVINMRGQVMQLIDLRVKLGLPSAKTELDELIQLLHDREQDHRNWLAELEASVRERRPFNLGRDPHACKFGRWYDHYQTENGLLKLVLKKMDDPHKLIHAAADGVLQLAEAGNVDGAMQLLAERKNHELAELAGLFAEARRLLREHHRELAVVLCHQAKHFAVSIDRVEAVERIPKEAIEPLPAGMTGGNAKQPWRVGQRLKTNQTILLLGEEFFLSSAKLN